MAASHKRLLRFPKQDYVAAKERLGALAEEDGREMWYDERKEMVGFRGESLADLKGFAEKCSDVLKWAESLRMNCDKLEMRMVEMDLAMAVSKADMSMSAPKPKMAMAVSKADMAMRAPKPKMAMAVAKAEMTMSSPQRETAESWPKAERCVSKGERVIRLLDVPQHLRGRVMGQLMDLDAIDMGRVIGSSGKDRIQTLQKQYGVTISIM